MKLDDITNAVIEELTASCVKCGIIKDIIDKQSFACFPESPTYVTYRARLEGTYETESGSLISLIDEWVSGGASIIVAGILMTVDSKCSVALRSLSEGQCLPKQPPTTNPIPSSPNATGSSSESTDGIPSTDSGSSDNVAAIVGGIVAVILIIPIVIIVAIIAVVITMKGRHREVSFRNAEE